MITLDAGTYADISLAAIVAFAAYCATVVCSALLHTGLLQFALAQIDIIFY